MKPITPLFAAVALLVLPGCGEKTPLPKGPPPEYEPARALPAAAIGDELPGATPPPPPAPPPAPTASSPAAPAASTAPLPSAGPAAPPP